MFDMFKTFLSKPWHMRLLLFSLFFLCCFMALFFFCRSQSQPVFFDQWFMEIVYSWQGSFADAVFETVTFIGGPLMPFLVAGLAVLLFFVFKKRIATLYFLGANIINAILVVAFKYFGDRAIPDDNMELADVANNYSFPSGHTAFSVMFFGALFWMAPSLSKNIWVQLAVRLVCTVLLVLVPLSRIYLYRHYPTDVLGGILLALGVLMGSLFILRLTYKREKNA